MGCGVGCWVWRGTRGKRGYDGSLLRGCDGLVRAGVAEAWGAGELGAGLGAQRGEIPAASAGMTDLFARV